MADYMYRFGRFSQLQGIPIIVENQILQNKSEDFSDLDEDTLEDSKKK